MTGSQPPASRRPTAGQLPVKSRSFHFTGQKGN
jgi:hypothetical protein